MSINDVKKRQDKIAEKTDDNSEQIAALIALTEMQTRGLDRLEKTCENSFKLVDRMGIRLNDRIDETRREIKDDASKQFRNLLTGVGIVVSVVSVVIGIVFQIINKVL